MDYLDNPLLRPIIGVDAGQKKADLDRRSHLVPGTSLGDAVDRIREMEREVGLPATVITSFQGNAQEFEKSIDGQGMLILMTVLVVYIILGVLYESFIHPITILSGLPAAGLGALLTLILFHQELTIIAFIGILTC